MEKLIKTVEMEITKGFVCSLEAAQKKHKGHALNGLENDFVCNLPKRNFRVHKLPGINGFNWCRCWSHCWSITRKLASRFLDEVFGKLFLEGKCCNSIRLLKGRFKFSITRQISFVNKVCYSSHSSGQCDVHLFVLKSSSLTSARSPSES